MAGLAGVSTKRAYQLTKTRTFPKPVAVLAMGPVWLERDVTVWLATPRAIGRPKNPAA